MIERDFHIHGGILRAAFIRFDPILAPFTGPAPAPRSPSATCPAGPSTALPPGFAMLRMASCRCGMTQNALPASSLTSSASTPSIVEPRHLHAGPGAHARRPRHLARPAGGQDRTSIVNTIGAEQAQDAQHVARRRTPAAMRRGHARAAIELQFGDARTHRPPQPLVHEVFVGLAGDALDDDRGELGIGRRQVVEAARLVIEPEAERARLEVVA